MRLRRSGPRLAVVALALLGAVGCRGDGRIVLPVSQSLSDFEREVLEHLGRVLY